MITVTFLDKDAHSMLSLFSWKEGNFTNSRHQKLEKKSAIHFDGMAEL